MTKQELVMKLTEILDNLESVHSLELKAEAIVQELETLSLFNNKQTFSQNDLIFVTDDSASSGWNH